MKEHPILFNSEMVRAILDGRKTQTRRVIKPQPEMRPGNDFVDGVWYEEDKYGDSYPIRCPYGQPGDHLWVRETHLRAVYSNDGSRPSERFAFYKADEWGDKQWEGWRIAHSKCPPTPPWKPSIYMPRWASRITLEIVSVRVERVQDISKDDAVDEGLEEMTQPEDMGGVTFYGSPQCGDRPPYLELDPRDAFMWLWDSINAKPRPVLEAGKIIAYRSYPWGEETRDPRKTINGKPHYCHPNPRVWVISFKEIDQ